MDLIDNNKEPEEDEKSTKEESKSDETVLTDNYFYKTYKIAGYGQKNSENSFYVKVKKFASTKRKKLFNLECYIDFFFKLIPILSWLPKYKLKSNLFPDLIAGNTVGIMNIPQGMAYSMLATLPPINGIYMSVFPILMYTIFGTSRHLTIGAVAIVSLLTGSTIDKIVLNTNLTALNYNRTNSDESNDEFRLNLAVSLAFLVGLIQLLMGIIGIGKFLVSYFSDTFISGYTCASAFHVVTSQIKELLGLRNVKKYDGIFKIPKSLFDMSMKLNTINWWTFALSVFCILFLALFKEAANPLIKRKIKLEFPSELVLVILLTTGSYVFDFNKKFNISIVKTVPRGLPSPKFPDLKYSHLLIMDAILIACIAFSISISLATLFSRKKNYKIDANQELYAFSISNMFSSCFMCFPNAGSLSRSSTLDTMGAKTQMASFFSSFFSFMVILWMGPLFESLTKNCLASIVIVALKSLLLQFKDFFSLWKINKLESIIWLITFVSTLFLNIDYGLFIGIGISIFIVVVKDQLIPIRTMVQYKNSSYYVNADIIKLENDEQQDTFLNAKIYKLEHSLYFANCEVFQSKLYEFYSPLKNENKKLLPESENCLLNLVNKEPNLVLDFSAVNYVDTNGVKKLIQIINDYKSIGVFVYICGAQEFLLNMLFNMKLLGMFNEHLFVSIHDALNAIKDKSTVLSN